MLCRSTTVALCLGSALWLISIRPAAAQASEPDREPPQIRHKPLSRVPPARAVEITARITDASRVAFPRLYFRRCGDSRYRPAPLVERGGLFVGTIPATAVTVDGLEYYLEAFDVHGNGPALHGSLEQPHRVQVAPPEADPATAPPASERVAPTIAEPGWHRLQLGAGAMLGWSPGGLSPSLEARLAAGLLPRPWLAVELAVGLPVVPPRVSGVEGEARIDPLLVALQARAMFRRESRLGLSLGVGAGVLMVRMSGTPSASYISAVDWVTCSLLYGLGGLSVRLGSRWSIGLTALLGVALPRPVVRFAEREVGSLGRPLLGVALGLQVGLF